MKYLEQLFITIVTISIVASLSLNVYLLSEATKQTEYKEKVLRLKKQRSEAVNYTLYYKYCDSVNNAVNEWLQDGTSK